KRRLPTGAHGSARPTLLEGSTFSYSRRRLSLTPRNAETSARLLAVMPPPQSQGRSPLRNLDEQEPFAPDTERSAPSGDNPTPVTRPRSAAIMSRTMMRRCRFSSNQARVGSDERDDPRQLTTRHNTERETVVFIAPWGPRWQCRRPEKSRHQRAP